MAGLLYFVSPIDLIPDVIPGLGLTDDVVILGLIIRQVSSDLDKYKAWKEGNGENTGDF
ncbi:MAG: YkvA family protein [Eubacteriales bacterium]|nr:YkvA family protein [Eubacteriales bacterium]